MNYAITVVLSVYVMCRVSQGIYQIMIGLTNQTVSSMRGGAGLKELILIWVQTIRR